MLTEEERGRIGERFAAPKQETCKLYMATGTVANGDLVILYPAGIVDHQKVVTKCSGSGDVGVYGVVHCADGETYENGNNINIMIEGYKSDAKLTGAITVGHPLRASATAGYAEAAAATQLASTILGFLCDDATGGTGARTGGVLILPR